MVVNPIVAFVQPAEVDRRKEDVPDTRRERLEAAYYRAIGGSHAVLPLEASTSSP